MESDDLLVCAVNEEKLISEATWLWMYQGHSLSAITYNPEYIAKEKSINILFLNVFTELN